MNLSGRFVYGIRKDSRGRLSLQPRRNIAKDVIYSHLKHVCRERKIRKP